MTRHSSAFALAAVAFAACAASIATAPAQAASALVFIEKQQPGEWLAHRLVGTKVLNASAEAIGEVKDVVIDKNGAVSTIVIGVGGFLGIPEKLVAVPAGVVQIGDVVQSSRIVVLDVTKEALKAAPAYVPTDPSATERVKQKATDWLAAAKAKALELGKAASDKAKALTKEATEKAKEMSAPKDAAPAPAPAPEAKP